MKAELIEKIHYAVQGKSTKEDFFKTPDEIISECLEQYHKAKLKELEEWVDIETTKQMESKSTPNIPYNEGYCDGCDILGNSILTKLKEL